ncbi:MAG: site-2 protease family protein [Cyanobacteria bacterium P01_A01_bin.116]
MITILLLVAAVGILVWGYRQAKPYGKPGILAWLQTVVLMVPWLLFFGFSAVGIYLNLAGILLLVVSSAAIYIYLGRRLRVAGKDELAAKRAAALISNTAEAPESDKEQPSETHPLNTQPSNTQPAQENTTSTATKTTSEAVERDQASTASGHETADHKAAGHETTSPTGTPVTTGSANNDDAKVEPEGIAPQPPIPTEDLAVIEGIFGIDTFFRTKTVPYQEGAIFKGNLRGKPDATAQTLSQKLSDKFGDRYRAFLLSDPENKPVVVVLPKENGPKPTSIGQRILAVALAIATLATSLETAGILQSFDIFQSPERWQEALPIALGLASVLGIHEAGHRIVASRFNIQLSPPFFLPAWQLGAFGSITRFESILPNRSVLFDISFAGPAAGGLLSFAFLFLGLVLSHPGSLFQLPADFFQGSIFVGTLARAVLGDALQGDLVDVHPLMVVGWIGLIITSINLMPAGQLDGGRIVQAIYGRKTLIRATTVTLVLLALVGLFNPLALYWAVLIVFLQRQPERPCTDDLSEPDDARAALALLSLFLMLMVLLPLTPSLAVRLGIG